MHLHSQPARWSTSWSTTLSRKRIRGMYRNQRLFKVKTWSSNEPFLFAILFFFFVTLKITTLCAIKVEQLQLVRARLLVNITEITLKILKQRTYLCVISIDRRSIFYCVSIYTWLLYPSDTDQLVISSFHLRININLINIELNTGMLFLVNCSGSLVLKLLKQDR